MYNTLLALAAQGPEGQPVVYHGPPWWPIFPIFWLLIFLAVVTIFAVRRRRWGGACGYGHGPSGLDRLAERYASGDIDENEYRARRAVLEEQVKRRQ
jgi:putative membrane protein